jgi:undecaprenyl-diphosphatase
VPVVKRVLARAGRGSAPPKSLAGESPREELSLAHALVLGAVHGPTELLPVSSSAHTVLIPWLAGWGYGDLDSRSRKSFEVALHAGTLGALLISSRVELARAVRELDLRRTATLTLAVLPAALVGYLAERTVERRLGNPSSISIALLCGAGCMGLADLCGGEDRTIEMIGPVDGLLLGLAQAAALVPGVSRNGATLTAGRARGLRRADAERLSWEAGFPVLLGASALRVARFLQSDEPAAIEGPVVLGAASAFLSSMASIRLMGPRRRAGSLLPYCVYRCLLAALVIVKSRRDRRPTTTRVD